MKKIFTSLCFALVLFLPACPEKQDEEGPLGYAGPGAASVKRGLGYNFTTSGGNGNTTLAAAADMDLLKGGVTWFYNWGPDANAAVASEAAARKLAFFPMAWSTDWNQNRVKAHIDRYPSSHILAYNEPNLTNQANKTPAGAAADWPRLKNFAAANGLKIISPAMQYGTLPGYGDPVTWLDEFFAQPEVSVNDIDGISIHCYMDYPGPLKSYIDRFKKYNKPVWMTEFCAWDNGNLKDYDTQLFLMSQACMYMEQDPAVARYAWFIAKEPGNQNTVNDNNLLTRNYNPDQNMPKLTGLGLVYVNMSTCDKTVWYPAGRVINAKDFSANNLSEITANGASWQDSVTFRPTADNAPDAAILDIFNFKPNMWVEYQVNVPQSGNYTLALRLTPAANTLLKVTVDGTEAAELPLYAGPWTTTTASLYIPAGRHTLRLGVSSGNCSLNRLKLD